MQPRSVPQETPAISRLVGLIRTANMIAATMAATPHQPKSFGRGTVSYREPAFPAIQFPMLEARNHIPITNPTARAGASLVMALRPTGLRHISPTTLRKYDR